MQLRWPPFASSGSDARTHFGWWRRAPLLEEPFTRRTVGRAHERRRPAREVGEHHRRDAAVVVDHVGLAEARGRVQQLVEVRERQLPAVDLDLTSSRAPTSGPTPRP